VVDLPSPPPGPACTAPAADAGASLPALFGFVGHDSSEGVSNLIYCHLAGAAKPLEGDLRWCGDGLPDGLRRAVGGVLHW
jgi:hypothetical protein